MSDRELLGLAAKALGIPIMGFNDDDSIERADGGWWDPRGSFMDCVGMAHELGLTAIFTQQNVMISKQNNPAITVAEPVGLYEHVAFMRAILRAAAEIGRTMP